MVEKEKQKARLKKGKRQKGNSFVRLLKKWLYYKPKTFLGVTVASAMLTAIVTAYVQKCFDFNLPFSKHLKRHDKTVLVEKGKKPCKGHKDDKVDSFDKETESDSYTITQFLEVLGKIMLENSLKTENMLQLNCPTCTESIKITAPVNKGVTITCNACQKQLFTQLRMNENVHE